MNKKIIVILLTLTVFTIATCQIVAADSSFTDLSNEIQTSDNEVNLTQNNYKNTGSESAIIIDHSITINGKENGTIIDANNKSGIFILKNGVSLTINNLILKNGYAPSGSAIYANSNSAITLIIGVNNQFINNTATNNGGAIYCYSKSDLTIIINNLNTFTSNNANNGGAIMGDAFGKTTLNIYTNNNFNNNNALNNGGAISLNSAFMVKTTIFENNTFIRNTATNGGALSIASSIFNNVYISNKNLFINNTAKEKGGAIYLNSESYIGEIEIKDGNIFTNNKANYGGAIYSNIININGENIFNSNKANYGGALYSPGKGIIKLTGISIFKNNTGIYGGAMMIKGTVNINGLFNCEYNTAHQGGVIYADNVIIKGSGTLTNNKANIDDGRTPTVGGVIYANNNVLIDGKFDFNKNYAKLGGGVIFTNEVNNKKVIIKGDNNFAYNYAGQSGGAIYAQDSVIVEGKATFYNNTANDYGGAIYVNEGSLTLIDGNFYFNNNNAFNGAAIYTNVIKNPEINKILNIKNALFTDNIGTNGRAIFTYAEIININQCIFDDCLNNNRANEVIIDTYTLNLTVNINDNFWGTNLKANEFNNKLLLVYFDFIVMTIVPSWWILLDIEPINKVTVNQTTTFNINFTKRTNGTTIEPFYKKMPTYYMKIISNNETQIGKQGDFNFTYGEIGTNSIIVKGLTSNKTITNYTFNVTTASFTDLSRLIDENDVLNLTSDIIYNPEYDTIYENGIKIFGNKTINGNDYSIDGANIATFFKISEGSSLTLNEVNLINGNGKDIINFGTLRIGNFVSGENIINHGNISSFALLTIYQDENNETFKASLKAVNNPYFILSEINIIMDEITITDNFGNNYTSIGYENGYYVFNLPTKPGTYYFTTTEIPGLNNLKCKGTIIIESETSFKKLQQLIDETEEGGVLELNNDYEYEYNHLIITKDITINGNNHILNGNYKGRIFDVFEGCTLTLNNLNLVNSINSAISNNGKLIISDCTFENNTGSKSFIIITTYGGAICNYGELFIKESAFNNNTATYGGAIYNIGNGIIKLTYFLENNATYGGAIHNEGNLLLNESIIFDSNKASGTFFGKIIIGKGGAIFNRNNLTIIDGIFESNIAEEYGGAIISENGNIIIEKSRFYLNSATTAGTIYIDGKAIINENRFSYNNATNVLGGIFINKDSYALITNNFFRNNTDPLLSIAIANNGTISLKNNTFINNKIGNIGFIDSVVYITVLTNETIKINQTIPIIVYLTDDNGNMIYDPRGITININGTLINATYEKIPEYTFTEYGIYNIIASYNYSNITKQIITPGQVIVEDEYQFYVNDLIKYYGGLEQLEVIALKNNKPLVNQTITFTVNNKTYNRVTNEEGIAILKINLNPGKYQVFIFSEYSTGKFEKIVNVTVLSTIEGENITKTFKNDTQYYAYFTDSEGNPLINTNITFNINGVFYTRMTNESGIAKLNINLNPDTYILTAFNPFTNQSYSNTITVLPILIGKDLTKTFSSTDAYEVIAFNNQQKPLTNVEISININGIIYNKITNSNAVAKLNINLNPGEYIVTSSFNGYTTSNKITVLEA